MLLLSLLMIFSLSASANPLPDFLETLASKKHQRSMKNWNQWQQQSPQEAKNCRDSYKAWSDDGVIQVHFALGYHDTQKNSKTYDHTLYYHVRNTLTRSCSGLRSRVCGFKENTTLREGSLRAYDKKVSFEQRPVTLRVFVNHSSHHTVDANNFKNRRPTKAQAYLTRRAEALFFGGISGQGKYGQCDVCVYNGHARDGGGPDFAAVPLNRRKRNGGTIYSRYQKNPVNYQKLLQSLNAQSNNQMIVLFGCNSKEHFWDHKTCMPNRAECQKRSMKDFSANKSFLITDRLSWPDNFGRYASILLDGIVEMKCRSGLQRSYNKLKNNRRWDGTFIGENYQFHGSF